MRNTLHLSLFLFCFIVPASAQKTLAPLPVEELLATHSFGGQWAGQQLGAGLVAGRTLSSLLFRYGMQREKRCTLSEPTRCGGRRPQNRTRSNS